MKKDMLYAICCLAFTIIIGGAVYEHLNVVPRWTAGPPASLSMFQGKYGLNPALFWKIIHPVNLLLFALNLVFHWRSERRRTLLLVLSSYIVILIITAVFFVPELISITTASYAQITNAELTRRAATWETLSIVHLVILIVMALGLFTGLTKANKPVVTPAH
ncbi:hypothetical protein EXU57_14555 [Segetibacter sp. 3557_3]|uniref:hypothetical protein n=1 Tax=Segetibacter sp. 3557_3 TaxID=2547429 RepID=UPI00105919E9|nr:hypothetical protein [Segetibacter sp. 3557_3]TDH24560.1 hypothetical protein EXU57_14555 [Segetibacter sp. 3557_3]